MLWACDTPNSRGREVHSVLAYHHYYAAICVWLWLDMVLWRAHQLCFWRVQIEIKTARIATISRKQIAYSANSVRGMYAIDSKSHQLSFERFSQWIIVAGTNMPVSITSIYSPKSFLFSVLFCNCKAFFSLLIVQSYRLIHSQWNTRTMAFSWTNEEVNVRYLLHIFGVFILEKKGIYTAVVSKCLRASNNWLYHMPANNINALAWASNIL